LKAVLFCCHVTLCLALAVLDCGAATVAQGCMVLGVGLHYYLNAWLLARPSHHPLSTWHSNSVSALPVTLIPSRSRVYKE